MNKSIFVLTVMLLCASFSSGQKDIIRHGTDDGTVKVYVTKSGKCYHKADCHYLKGKDGVKVMTLKQVADKHLRPCKVCKPPKV